MTGQPTGNPTSYAYTPISTTATTLVKTGKGVLHSIVINKAVVNSVITVYDALTATGTPIATITLPGTLISSQDWLVYDIAFATGLCIVTATGACDLTVAWT